jgi:hypothetical protein
MVEGVIENGVFRPLKDGETIPPGSEKGFLDKKGKFHRVYLDSSTPSKAAVYIDDAGVLHTTAHIEDVRI